MTKAKSQWELDCLKRQEKINDYLRQHYQPRLHQVNKIVIYHPDEYRRYLKENPCDGCRVRPCCKGPCPVYQQWKDRQISNRVT